MPSAEAATGMTVNIALTRHKFFELLQLVEHKIHLLIVVNVHWVTLLEVDEYAR